MKEMKFPGFDITISNYGHVGVVWSVSPPPLLERPLFSVLQRFVGTRGTPQVLIQMRQACFERLNYEADRGALFYDGIEQAWRWEVSDRTNPFIPHVEWADGPSEYRFWHDLGVELGLRKHCNDGPY